MSSFRQIAEDDLDKVQIALLSISSDWHGESMMPKLRSPLRSDQTADPCLESLGFLHMRAALFNQLLCFVVKLPLVIGDAA